MTARDQSPARIRDRIQHDLVAALAEGDAVREPQRLVFKGGTLLRACGLPDYRYSEDLDFDWMGAAAGFRAALADAARAASGSGTFLDLPVEPPRSHPQGKGIATSVLWTYQGLTGAIPVDATLIAAIELPTQHWPIRRHPDTPTHGHPIRGYTLEAVLSDKLSCISHRRASRDFYDIDQLLSHGVDMDTAWDIYIDHYANLRHHYGWRPFPTDIRTSYTRRLPQIAAQWDIDVGNGVIPDGVRFIDAYTRVDAAVATALDAWVQQQNPVELDWRRDAHDRLRPHRSSRGGLRL